MTAYSAEKSVADGVSPSQLFVINLCASTSPMALSHPSSPELKRYTFFVSRQREEGRERFRLHMGYFSSQDDAEALLAAVRDVYPAAWAGPAPSSGAGRRGRATPAAPMPVPVTMVAAPPQLVEPAMGAAPVASAPVSAPAPAEVTAAVAPAVPAAPEMPVLHTMSNVHDVLAQLSDEAPREIVDVAAPVVAPAAAAPAPAPALKLVPASQPAAAEPLPELDESQTMRMLEIEPPKVATKPRAAQAPVPATELSLEGEPEVRVVTPEDTQTLTDIRIDAQNNAPPCFAVQLVWSVSPIDVSALPHLAIFDAYTLYNVEGNRQGRKWYGLRLGFFSDPNSATQVAHYVRSDYSAVAVVPVATKERDRASDRPEKAGAPRLGAAVVPLKPAAQLPIERQGLEGFELLADDRPAPIKRDLDDAPTKAAQAARPKAAAANTPRTIPVASPRRAASAATPNAGKPLGKRVVVRKRPDAPIGRAAPGAPTPLESTLEILGASTLTLDDSRAIINDSAVRKPLPKKAGNNRFSKLLSRLSGG